MFKYVAYNLLILFVFSISFVMMYLQFKFAMFGFVFHEHCLLVAADLAHNGNLFR